MCKKIHVNFQFFSENFRIFCGKCYFRFVADGLVNFVAQGTAHVVVAIASGQFTFEVVSQVSKGTFYCTDY